MYPGVTKVEPLARNTVRFGPSSPASISTATVSKIAGAI